MFKKIIFIALLVQSSLLAANNFLDTQYGQDGVEVHLLKAKVTNNVLTIAFMVDNSTEKTVRLHAMPVQDVHYTTKDKKYTALKDTEGKWLASTITYGSNRTRISNILFSASEEGHGGNHEMYMSKKEKRIGWVKFEAPADDQWPIEVTLPGVTPFAIEKPQ